MAWWLADSVNGHISLSPLGDDKEVAIIDAMSEWRRLPGSEKKRRDGFFIVLCEDGNLASNAWKERIDIKEMEKK